MSYNLEFVKAGKTIKLELEAPITELEGFSLITNTVFTKFEIDGIPMAEGKKLKYISFTYASKSPKEKVFCLYLNDKSITQNVLNALGNPNPKSNALNMTLPQEIEDFYKNTIVPLEAKAEEDYQLNLEKEKEENNKELINLNPMLRVTYNTTYKYNIGTIETSLKKLAENSILKDIKIMMNNNLDVCKNDYFEEYLKDSDWGDYSISYTYQLTLEQLLNIKNKLDILIEEKQIIKAKKEAERKAKKDREIAEAKEKNINIEVGRWTEPCNDPKEECNVDIIIEYVTPNGEYITKRNHTW